MNTSHLRELKGPELHALEQLHAFFGKRAEVFLEYFKDPNDKNKFDKELHHTFLHLFASRTSTLREKNPISLADVEKLISFFGSMARPFSANFEQKKGDDVTHKNTFLGVFTSEGHEHRVPALLNLLKNRNFTIRLASFINPSIVLSVLGNFLPADKLLDATLPIPDCVSLSESSDSSVANAEYRETPLKFEHVTPNDTKIRRMWKAFEAAITGIYPELFYNPTYSKRVQLEGDVADFCVVNILLPVVAVMNVLLKQHCQKKRRDDPTKWEIILQAQYRNRYRSSTETQPTVFVDHCLVLHGRDGQASTDITLVIFEEKIIGAVRLKQWYDFSRNIGWMPIPASEDSMDLFKIVPQIRKYVFDLETPYAMVSDAYTHIGMIWGAAKNWSSAKNPCVDRYDADIFTKRTKHSCRFMPCMSGENHQYLPPRRVLAFLCYLALYDYGFIAL